MNMPEQIKIRAIAFDVNGTLFDDTQTFWAAINDIFPKYGKERLPLKTLQKKFGQPWTSIYREFGISEARASDDELYGIYNQLYERQNNPMPVRGLQETLDWLEQNGIPLTIISTQQNTITIPLLEQYGLSTKFLKVYGGVSNKAVALRHMMAILRLLPKQIAYVGDQEGDMRHAKNADCISIAFCGGLHDRERLQRANPDFIIETISELKRLPIF